MCRWNAYFGQPLLVEELLRRAPESTAMIIQTGADETQSFQPHWP